MGMENLLKNEDILYCISKGNFLVGCETDRNGNPTNSLKLFSYESLGEGNLRAIPLCKLDLIEKKYELCGDKPEQRKGVNEVLIYLQSKGYSVEKK